MSPQLESHNTTDIFPARASRLGTMPESKLALPKAVSGASRLLPPRASPQSHSLTKAAPAASPAVLSYNHLVSPHSKKTQRLPRSPQQVALMGVQPGRASPAYRIPAQVFCRFQPRSSPSSGASLTALPDDFKPFTSLLKGKPGHSLPQPWSYLPSAELLLSTQ